MAVKVCERQIGTQASILTLLVGNLTFAHCEDECQGHVQYNT